MTERDDKKIDDNDRMVHWIDDGSHDDQADSREWSDEDLITQLLTNSLLTGHFESPDDQEARIQATLKRFEDSEHDLPATDQRSGPQVSRSKRAFISRAVKVFASLAALLLVAASVWYVSLPQSAEAALQRIIESVEEKVTRVYSGTVKGEWWGRARTMEITLRSCSSDRFAVEVHNANKKLKVIGANGQNRWYISGRRTWKSNEETNALRDFLMDRITIRNLRCNELITGIPDHYELEFLEVEPLPGNESVECRPIEATRITDEDELPHVVRIWAHPKTGVVSKMEIVRERSGKKASTFIELLLTGEEPVTDEVFQPEFYLK